MTVRQARPGPKEALIARIYQDLDAIQWWSPERLREQQFRQLARLVERARRHVPFYAETLQGVPAGAGGGLDAAAWTALPLLTKVQIRADPARLRSQYLPPHLQVETRTTSGSSGTPLEVIQTSEYWSIFYALKLRLLRWHGYDVRGKLIEILPPRGSHQPGKVRRLPQWEWPFGALFDSGQYLRADIFTDIAWQLDLLEREAPQYLVTQPSNLRLLLRAVRRSGRRLPSLRLVRTQAEQLDPALRAECREVLGVPLVDTYGATETGYIAIQCPEYDHYHVQSELNLVEILDEDGHPCGPGQTGRIVVTPLYAFAMPLLRYDLGDYAEVGEPCPCGRGLPVLRRIFGRHKELLTLPSGEKRYSTFGSRIFAALPAVAQFQIAQTGLAGIEARIVAERPLTRDECAEITTGLAKQLGPEFTIRLVFVDSIPRLPGGKYMEFVSEISPPG